MDEPKLIKLEGIYTNHLLIELCRVTYMYIYINMWMRYLEDLKWISDSPIRLVVENRVKWVDIKCFRGSIHPQGFCKFQEGIRSLELMCLWTKSLARWMRGREGGGTETGTQRRGGVGVESQVPPNVKRCQDISNREFNQSMKIIQVRSHQTSNLCYQRQTTADIMMTVMAEGRWLAINGLMSASKFKPKQNVIRTIAVRWMLDTPCWSNQGSEQSNQAVHTLTDSQVEEFQSASCLIHPNERTYIHGRIWIYNTWAYAYSLNTWAFWEVKLRRGLTREKKVDKEKLVGGRAMMWDLMRLNGFEGLRQDCSFGSQGTSHLGPAALGIDQTAKSDREPQNWNSA